MSDLSQIIREARERSNLEQKDLAQLVGVSQQTVSKWEQGTIRPSMKRLRSVSEHLNLPINELLVGLTNLMARSNTLSEQEQGPGYQRQVGRVRSPNTRTPEVFVEIPFLSAKAQAGPARLILNDCQPDTGETHPVLAELIDKRFDYLVLQIDGHSMETELRPGNRVLARRVQPDEIPFESGGVYAIYYADRLVVKRIRTNDLRGKGTLTLHSDNEQYGQINVMADEIQCVWRVLYTIYQPVR